MNQRKLKINRNDIHILLSIVVLITQITASFNISVMVVLISHWTYNRNTNLKFNIFIKYDK